MSFALAEEHCKSDKRVNDGEVARLDADDEEHEKLNVAVEHADSDQHSEDSAHRAG